MHKRRIFIVEDESLIALEIETRLKNLGYDVCGKADNSEEALALVSSQKPDLILMDIMIKGKLDGIETAHEINKNFSIPIIYLTAFVDHNTLNRAKETNPFGYLTKPIQERDLRSTIAMALHKSQLENELNVTKNWLQTTLSSIGDAVIVTDITGKINFMNSVAQNLTGWNLKEALDKNLEDVFVIEEESTGNIINDVLKDVKETGEPKYYSTDINLISRNDQKISIVESTAAIKDENNSILGYVLVFHDNTERKNAQLILESESNFRKLLIESAAEGIIAFTGLTTFPNIFVTVWNKRMEEITGYTKDEINSLGLYNTPLISNDEGNILEIVSILKENERISGGEIAIVDKDNNKKFLSLSASKIKNQFDNDLVIGLITDLTSRKHVEQKIRESEENFRNLAANTPVGIFIHRGEEIYFANKIGCEILERSFDELLKLKFWEIFHPDYKERLSKISYSLLNDTGKSKTFEAKIITKSGAEKWVDLTATRTVFNGSPALIAITVDTTERKKIEEKILLFAHAIRNISDCVTITDLDNNLIYINEAFEKTYGYTSQEIIGKHISFVTYYPKESIEEIRLKTLDEGWSGELLNVKKDGTVFPIILKTSTIYDDNENPVGLVGVATDITESKLAEKKIKQSEKDYRGLFESAQDAILIFRPEDEVVLDVNQKACEMYGFTKEKLIGLSLESISVNISTGKKHIDNTLKEGERYQFETTQLKADGSPIELEISASVFEYNNQKVILSINRDITERKRNERALRQSEERYRNLFETMNQGVIYFDSDGKILSANHAALQILGVKIEQIIGKTTADHNWKLFKEDGTQYLFEELPVLRVFETGVPIMGKIIGVYNKSADFQKWLLVDAIPEFFYSYSGPHQVFVTFSDITQLRKAEDIQRAFFKISEASSSSVTLEGLFASIHNIIRKLIRAENFYIALLDKKNNSLLFPYFVDEFESQPLPRKMGNGFTELVIKENKIIALSKEEFAQIQKQKNLKRNTPKSSCWMGVPLRIDEEVIGAVVVQEYKESKPYSVEDQNILLTISNQIALSIQRKIFSDAISESEEKYRSIFNTVPIGIFQTDVYGRLTTVNNTFKNILGYSPAEDLYNYRIEKFFTDNDKVNNVLSDVLSEGSVIDSEFEWKRKDGKVIWVELSLYHIKTDSQDTDKLEGFIKDVTQRKLDEELILQLSSGIEQSPTSVVITDLNGNIQYVNPRFEEQTGYTLEEVKGQNPRIIKSDKNDSSIYENLWSTITQGKQWRGELLNKKKNGELFWELAIIFPLNNSAGKISQYIGIKVDITEKKQLESELKVYQEHLEELIKIRTEELILSEQKFKALAENSDDLIIRFNKNLEIVYMNPIVTSITGNNVGSLIGSSIDKINFEKSVLEKWESAIQKVFKLKSKHRAEFAVQEGLWIDWVLIPEFDANGNVISVLTFGRDITAMKNVESELFRKDRLLQGVATASNILFTLEDFDVRINNALEVIGKSASVSRVYIYENKIGQETISALPILAYDWVNPNYHFNEICGNEDLFGKNFEVFKNLYTRLQSGSAVAADASNLEMKIQEVLDENKIKFLINIPIEVFGKFWGFIGLNDCHNERFWSESEIAILTTLASDIGGAIARKIVENQLRNSEERLKILFDYAPEAYFIFDHDGLMLDANKEAVLTFGYLKEELIDKKRIHNDLFSGEYVRTVSKILSDCRMDIPTGPDELEIIRKDNTTASIELNTYPVTINGKKLILGAAHDISLRKKAEGEIRNALKHSQDLNQMKSRFVSMVSHEFRTPLSTILSSLELLEQYSDKLTKAEKKSHFAKITKSVDYLTELLDDVITINRADSGRLEVKYDDFELVELVKHLISEIRGSYLETPSIDFKTARNFIYARTDEKLFRQIISNLVNNAIKYTQPSKKIFINLDERDKHFIFEIRDEGVGIPAASQHELFTPFYRASNIGSVPGSGLGLAITKRSVDLLKGLISFSSAEYEGTTFIVKLPINQDSDEKSTHS